MEFAVLIVAVLFSILVFAWFHRTLNATKDLLSQLVEQGNQQKERDLAMLAELKKNARMQQEYDLHSYAVAYATLEALRVRTKNGVNGMPEFPPGPNSLPYLLHVASSNKSDDIDEYREKQRRYESAYRRDPQ